MSKDNINNIIDNIVPEKPLAPVSYLCEDDMLDIREYINNSSILQKKCNHVLESELFNFLVSNYKNLSEQQLSQAIQILWNRDEYIGKLWLDMLSHYETLKYKSKVYARFDSVLKRKGTLLDVARLDEMYGSPEDIGTEYEPYAEVKL